ncbi:uncharacterized protein Pyn_21552 [Prunus yedoensis var. nudiflora]|uniref:Uncharacterized protein n=1 Tax=Prunus yedoensis var. nudiflora TaxID=2094558 RepID=A0A314YKV1_PRUYE|nr:uncharacterized protein Pyn_21552 [Prunus yedoensis var. nudiflora]
MEDRCDSGKGLLGRRVSTELGQERDLGSRKRLKMRDLESVCRSEGINPHHTKSLKNKESSGQFQSSGAEMSQVTEVPITLDLDASQAGKAWSKTLSVVVNPASRPLDLNTDMCLANNTVQDDSQQCPESSGKITLLRDPSNCVNEKGIRLDLNAEDASIAENQDPFYPYKNTNHLKPRAVSECGSCTGPLEEKDSMRVWKEMKQNGFLSSTHGGIPMPKQRTKKSKNEELKKKMERAKREQVDRFAKIAAPSGLLNELNPGIINHVRNRKQDKGGDGERTTVDRLSGRRFMSHSVLENEEDTLAFKLPSSTNASEDDSPLSNEETASYLSIKAATIASQWLGLILQDIKGRLAALRRSRKRVRDVITTDLPSLLSKEFPSDQENDPCITKNSTSGFPSCTIADMHRARWNPLFEQMDKALSEEEDQLESWLNQVKEMQLHCDQGLQIVQWNTASGIQQLGTSENDPRSHILDNSDRALAVRAAAASIYSTCNFLLSTNVPCF